MSVMAHPSFLSDHDLYLFNEGTHVRLYEKLGAHPVVRDGQAGTYFAVWAPNAREVSVFGNFNGWNKTAHFLKPCGQSGIWETFVPGIGVGELYKFHIKSHQNGYEMDKSDPFAFFSQMPPDTASVVWDLNYSWNDREWMKNRHEKNNLHAPISIYEMHLGSWKHIPGEGNRSLSYRELAPQLVSHLKKMNFTHVEFLPIMEHPFYASWGYQVTGYFSPTSRFGNPQDLMFLIDQLHQAGIGVILDWVPSHFPNDSHGLAYFDGTNLYEHADPKQGFHPDWKSAIFNYGRHEVRSFLLSSALFWLDKYHVDGLRVDGVASMLYLDYSRKEGEWVPNAYGGNENIEAISFLRQLNQEIYKHYPDVQTIAEESTAWSMVSRPTYLGGLGFGLKWDMGWMHDTLTYMAQEPVHRKYHHHTMTFRMLYAFTENFVLPLSHDEVVHGKASLLSKMPGDMWQKHANLRALLAYMMGQPGKKLLFMGGEFGQWEEWNHNKSLDWHLLQYKEHEGDRKWVEDLNKLYRNERALYELDCVSEGFEWLDANDCDQSTYSFIRKNHLAQERMLVVVNLTPVPRFNYRLGVPWKGYWKEMLNSDAVHYGGSGLGNMGGVQADEIPSHGHPYSVNLTVPPLAGLFLKNENG